jgi:4-diphosphocytidyl-2-C-methyl-D-erythritol kinase
MESTKSIVLRAPAKVNLSLRILARREDGYHELETLMTPLDLSDEVELSIQGQEIVIESNVSGLPLGPGNLAWKAVEAFYRKLEIVPKTGVAIRLQKRIPVGGGLGGGSSNAAAVLRGLNILHGLPLEPAEMLEIAASLGSDVPFFLEPNPAICRGRGEILSPLSEYLPSWKFLLIFPPFGISTPWAFSRWKSGKETRVSLDGIEFSNDLEPGVFSKHLVLPVLKKWLLSREEVRHAQMSGSGSTIFAILQDSCSTDSLVSCVAGEFGPGFKVVETRIPMVKSDETARG